MELQGRPKLSLPHDPVTAARAHCTCHSLTSRDTRCGQGVGWPCRTATRPRTFKPVRSPSSGSVNYTSTRPWAHQAHCHSPPVRVDSLRLMPSGSVRRTAPRALGVPAAPIALPLAPRARRFATSDAEWQCTEHCHSGLGRAGHADRTATRAPAHRFALPLISQRANTVRTIPSGRVDCTATRS